MTKKEFLRAVAHGKVDAVQALLDILKEVDASYCVIGGLAVNAYAEPVVSLDLDVVVIAQDMERVVAAAQSREFSVKRFAQSVNLASSGSDLRIQIQTDPRYQAFVSRASSLPVLGYVMNVAALPDLLQGKLWAYNDDSRRRSKRQKDLADILRLVETHPELKRHLPPDLAELA